ncbi:MAG: hypothetical protein OEW59_08105 [Gammaproteobacteria bacterium]|nr:hypothetical protein [Gammaproteobacteria bacterium]
MDTEHIYIGDEMAELAGEPATVTSTERIRNFVTGARTELTFYEEGFVQVRETRKNKLMKKHMLELRFLRSEPVVTRRLATPFLWTALSIGLAALLASLILPMTDVAGYTMSATASLATLAVIVLLMFIYRSDVTHRFCTANGHTVVLALHGSFGCMRRARSAARAIRKAIADAASQYDARDVRFLRAEMQAHYKLAETGVISREACSNGTSMILSKFG